MKISAATGRHFVIAAQKTGVVDVRPSDAERLEGDFHLQTLKMQDKND